MVRTFSYTLILSATEAPFYRAPRCDRIQLNSCGMRKLTVKFQVAAKLFLSMRGKMLRKCTMEVLLQLLTMQCRQEYDPIHPPDAITTNLPKDKQ